MKKFLIVLSILAAAPVFGWVGFGTQGAVAEINGNEVSGLSLYMENGFCLQLGFDNYQNKLRRLLPVITALNKKDLNRGLLNIDLRDIDKVYVERRGDVDPLDKLESRKGLST